jgi:5-aminolevulinate synthase
MLPLVGELCTIVIVPAIGNVASLVEALIDVWKALGLPFTTTRIVPLRHRRKPPKCIYPEMCKAAE